jgi:hypothetical protein
LDNDNIGIERKELHDAILIERNNISHEQIVKEFRRRIALFKKPLEPPKK